jgi:hypothetical protein
MLDDFGNKLINNKKYMGIKMVENNINYRVSDIFNMNKQEKYYDPNYNKSQKQKIIKLSENTIDEKLRVIIFYFII